MAESRQTLTHPSSSPFERLAAWSYGHRWWAVALWVAVLAGVTLASQALGSSFRNDFSLPGSDSQRVLDTLKQHAPAQAGATVQVVLQDPDGLRQSSTRERVEAMLGELRGLSHVVEVRSPYAGATAISRDGTTGYATVTLDGKAEEVPGADVRRIIDTARGRRRWHPCRAGWRSRPQGGGS